MNDKYNVLIDFTEPATEDKSHKAIKDRIYRKGEEFPREGYTPTPDRIKYLTSKECMKGKGPVIEAVKSGKMSGLGAVE